MGNLKAELAYLKMQINSHYGTPEISTSGTFKRMSEIKKMMKRIQIRKNKILSLTNGR
jgi:hypothetical protein